MSIHLYGAFLLACVVLAATPGPSMSLFIANGAAHGRRAALLTVFGSATGLSILVTAAALGLGSLMTAAGQWFDIIRWLGAAYLIWLGIMRLRLAFRNGLPAVTPSPRRGRWFLQGMAVSLSNPKVLLFLGAFFPQFVTPEAPLGPQLTLLAVTFVASIAAVDCSLALAVGSANGWLTAKRKRISDGVTGFFLVCGGLWLAAARRT